MIDTNAETALIEKIRQYDTPTICNAIEIAQGGRGFNAFTKRTMFSSEPTAPPVVGFARTARLRSNTAPTAPLEEVKALRMQYFQYLAAEPRASVVVIEDLDGDEAQGAWWGEIHTAVHKAIGLSGALTNGLMRDLGSLEPGFQVIAGGIGPSHALIHVEDFGEPVDIFGMRVTPGDLVHADLHGAVVVPPEVYTALPGAIDKLLELETYILEPARKPGFNVEKLAEAWADYEAHRAQ
ncbi:MAG: RraA family protein [Alphaproteobacteria bacterium]